MSIQQVFKKFLHVEENEFGGVALLLIMSFFLGVFLASFSVASQALFLQKFQEVEWLPYGLIASGVFGVAATYGYNFLQSRVSFRTLGLTSLMVITALTAFIEFGPKFFDQEKIVFLGQVRDFTHQDLVYFIGFSLLAPFTFVSLLIFWGTFNRLFNVRQSKRLLGSVDIGYLLASLIAFFAIPILLNKNVVQTEGLFQISLAGVICFTVLFFILVTQHVEKHWTFKMEKENIRKMSFRKFFKTRYLVYLSLFLVVSMTAMNTIDYTFLVASPQQFDANTTLPKFLSYFEATVVIFTFLFQTFATDRIIDDYGLRVAMLINPLIIGLFTAGAFAVGIAFGYTNISSSFVIFFVMVAMSKLFASSMRDSIDEPAFKLYELPIDTKQKIDVQTKLEGTIIAFGSVTAGVLIILISRLPFFNLLIPTIVLIPLVFVWYFASNRMYGSYRTTLRGALERNKEKEDTFPDDDEEFRVDKVLEKQIQSTVEDKVIYGLRLMEKLEPAMFESTIVRLSESDSPKVKAFAAEKLKQLGIEEDKTNNEIKSLAAEALEESQDSDLISVSPEKLMRLSKSSRYADRLLSAKLLRRLINQRNIFILLELLRDVDPRVRVEALQTARKVKRPETWPVLIELLSSTTYGQYAASALIEAGEPVLLTLETAFHKSGQSDLTMMRIIQLMGRIGTPSALDLLWKKIDYPDKRIVKQILNALRYLNFKADTRQTQDIMELLDAEMSKTLWNLAAMHELPEDKEEFKLLRAALREEVRDNYAQITMLLSIIYDPKSVQLVKENIESGNPDKIQYALELLDLFVSPELKEKLFPLLDDRPVEEKLRELQLVFPRESYNPVQVINYILNRDFNLSNRWSKACAAYTAAFLPDFRISRGLISQMFNQDKLLQETAAWVIYGKSKQRYFEISERLPAKDKKFLESSLKNNQLLDGLNDGFFLAIEVVMFLKELPPLKNISGVRLADLADKVIPLDLMQGEKMNFNPDEQNKPIFIVAHGGIELQRDGESVLQLPRGAVYGEIFSTLPNFVKGNGLKAKERSVVFRINTMDFFFVLANHYEIVDGLMKNIGGRPVASTSR